MCLSFFGKRWAVPGPCRHSNIYCRKRQGYSYGVQNASIYSIYKFSPYTVAFY